MKKHLYICNKMRSIQYIKAFAFLFLVALFFTACQKNEEMFSPDSDVNSTMSDGYYDSSQDDGGVTDKDDNENDNDGGNKDKNVTDKDDNENDNDKGLKGDKNGGVTDKDDNENDNDGGIKTDE